MHDHQKIDMILDQLRDSSLVHLRLQNELVLVAVRKDFYFRFSVDQAYGQTRPFLSLFSTTKKKQVRYLKLIARSKAPKRLIIP